jgi:phosphoribosylcarboxyaminoimidazole (NCAIR) mutase
MSQEKDVLVLFYDRKDMSRIVGSPQRSIVDDLQEGFKGTGVKATIRTASPRHEPWLALEYFNEKKYDGIIIVGGMTCSLDVPHGLMEQLYDNKELNLKPRDWQNAEFERKATGKVQLLPSGSGKLKYHVSIEDTLDSKYHGQQRPVPMIGLPVKDRFSKGEFALASMIMASRPSSAAAVGIEQGYEAAQMMSTLLNTTWKEVKIVASDMTYEQRETRDTPEKLSPVHNVARDVCKVIDEAFKPYDDDRIPFGAFAVADYLRQLSQGDLKPRPALSDVLHVCVYDDFSDLERIASVANLVIGVYVPKRDLDFRHFCSASHEYRNVIHTRIGSGENAAVLTAHALYSTHPKLKPSRFTQLRRSKSEMNVEIFLEIMKEQGKNFEVKS